MTPTLFLRVLTFPALGMLLIGCSSESNLVKVKGKVLQDGKPVEVARGHSLRVSFWRVGDAKGVASEVYAARISKQGDFTVNGQEGEGIPPDKYRISVEMIGGPINPDRLKGKFSPDRSPIIRDVSKENAELTIDLDSPKG